MTGRRQIAAQRANPFPSQGRRSSEGPGIGAIEIPLKAQGAGR